MTQSSWKCIIKFYSSPLSNLVLLNWWIIEFDPFIQQRIPNETRRSFLGKEIVEVCFINFYTNCKLRLHNIAYYECIWKCGEFKEF